MTSLRNLLRYIWDGLGGQMAEVSVSFKIPAQIAALGFIALLTWIGVSVCGNGELTNGPYTIP